MKSILKIDKIKGIGAWAIFILLLIATTLHAQKPEPVYSIVKQLKPYEWYVEQARLWQQEISKDTTNAEAWYNFYIANRMANLTGKPKNWKNEKDKVLRSLNDIVDDMEDAIPESFEFNTVKFWNGGNSFELFPYLEKAYNIAPDRPDTYDDFITYYEVKRDIEKVDRFCHLWYASGDVSPGILNFNYNLMMSLEPNAIIFTAGDNDTYPLWILQYAKKTRQDVTVLNTSLIFIEEYARAMMEELKIPKFEKKPKDFVTDEIQKSQNYQLAYNAYQKALIDHIIKHAGDHPVYFSTTTPKSIYTNYENDMYLEGLAFKYATASYDNMAILKKNVEKRFLLDYLTMDFSNDFSLSVVNQTNLNYILPFLNLYEHYTLSGDTEKANRIKWMALTVAKRGGQEEQVQKQFEE